MGRTYCVQKLFWKSETISVHNMFSPGLSLEFSCTYWTCNSMNNLSSYCGLVDAKIESFWQKWVTCTTDWIAPKQLSIPHNKLPFLDPDEADSCRRSGWGRCAWYCMYSINNSFLPCRSFLGVSSFCKKKESFSETHSYILISDLTHNFDRSINFL